jgi:RNA polymerase sigma-70 factor (ECF subfamily)
MTKSSQYVARHYESLEMADEHLAERAHRDPGAYAELYDRYLNPVYRYFFLRLGSQPEAEDLTSQVFLAALESLPGYRRGSSFRAWLFGIARRKLADHYRLRRPQVSLQQVGDLPAAHEPVLAHLARSEQLGELAKLVAALQDSERELLGLRFAAGLSFPEMASLLKRKESAVKMSLYRLLERLERQLEAKDV